MDDLRRAEPIAPGVALGRLPVPLQWTALVALSLVVLIPLELIHLGGGLLGLAICRFTAGSGSSGRPHCRIGATWCCGR